MIMCCASCGAKEDGDGITLKKCTACYLVRYCSVKCQKEHRRQHKRACKKRAAELRDEILFKQPEGSHLGDCPICFLPLSLDLQKSAVASCCSKRVCCGCILASQKQEKAARLEHKCPFCRDPMPKSEEEYKIHAVNDKRKLAKRAEANDPVALCEMGATHHREGDYEKAFECFTKAVAFGNNVSAHSQLSQMYHFGRGVEKDEKKKFYHLEEAAIGGDAIARHNLGCTEEKRCKMDRAVKHYIIAANQGEDDSLETLKKLYQKGCRLVSKNVFTAALRAHKAAVEATKSQLREEAEQFYAFLKE